MKKEHIFNFTILKRRLVAVILLVGFVFFVLFGRLVILQLFSSNSLLKLANAQWGRELPIKAERGKIFDRNGEILALSYSTYDCFVRPSEVMNKKQVALNLSNIFNMDYFLVYEKISNVKVSEVLIKMQVEGEIAIKIKNKQMKGVYLTENTKRFYPNGEMLTQILGYTTIDNIGQTGLELLHNDFLRGKDGESIVKSDINGREIEGQISSFIPSIPGYDITLTIDASIQRFADNACMKIIEKEKPKSAQIIVMQPKTGEILANSILPSFNLNDIPRDNIEELNQRSKNITVSDVYEPGSTFKVLTTASSLEEKTASLDSRFYDPGYRIVEGEKIKCWKSIGHGSQNLIDGLNNSCNSVFVDLSLKLGLEKMYEYFDKYGFGKISGIDFIGESAGILMNKDNVKTVDLARMGFGQAIAVTPLQEITAIASVINGGNLMRPYYTKSIKSRVGDYKQEFTPKIRNKTVSKETSNTMCMMMEEVIKKASGYYSFIPGYRVGGKTGTSQKYVNGGISGEKFTSSFCGTFPADNPEYIIMVIVDEPSSGNYFGSIVATPYAKMVIEDIIKYKNYKPTEKINGDELEKTIPMPNLVGKSLLEAINILNSLNLQYEISGDNGIVSSQYPSPNELLFENAIVVLNTNKAV